MKREELFNAMLQELEPQFQKFRQVGRKKVASVIARCYDPDSMDRTVDCQKGPRARLVEINKIPGWGIKLAQDHLSLCLLNQYPSERCKKQAQKIFRDMMIKVTKEMNKL